MAKATKKAVKKAPKTLIQQLKKNPPKKKTPVNKVSDPLSAIVGIAIVFMIIVKLWEMSEEHNRKATKKSIKKTTKK